MTKKLKEFYRKKSYVEQAKLLEIVCLTTLIAGGQLSADSDIGDANSWYHEANECCNCPFKHRCVAIIVEE